jgi:hypothetical protein
MDPINKIRNEDLFFDLLDAADDATRGDRGGNEWVVALVGTLVIQDADDLGGEPRLVGRYADAAAAREAFDEQVTAWQSV